MGRFPSPEEARMHPSRIDTSATKDALPVSPNARVVYTSAQRPREGSTYTVQVHARTPR
jgi:hypothetical protein